MAIIGRDDDGGSDNVTYYKTREPDGIQFRQAL